jgi:5-methylcytosine-specific restriction endonuclease McrA
MPICITCNTEKPVEDYHTTGLNKTRKKTCKVCINTARRESRKQNPEKYKLQDQQDYIKNRSTRLVASKTYRENNKEKCDSTRKTHYEANLEKFKEKNTKYYAENRDSILLQAKEYYNNNKEAKAAYKKAYNSTPEGRLRIKNNRYKYKAAITTSSDGTVTTKALQHLALLQEHACHYCGCPINETESATHLDHFIPISKGGTHSITNVVWSCDTCNLSKNATIPSTTNPVFMTNIMDMVF